MLAGETYSDKTLARTERHELYLGTEFEVMPGTDLCYRVWWTR